MSNGFVTGSARSVPGFDLSGRRILLGPVAELADMYAAGLTMPERVESSPAVQCLRGGEHRPQMLVPQVDIDSELFSDITPTFRKDSTASALRGRATRKAGLRDPRRERDHGDAKTVGMEASTAHGPDAVGRQKPNKIQVTSSSSPHYEWCARRPIDVCYQIIRKTTTSTVN